MLLLSFLCVLIERYLSGDVYPPQWVGWLTTPGITGAISYTYGCGDHFYTF